MNSLFAQQVAQADPRWLEFLSHPETLVLLVPIVFILMFGIVAILKTLIRHRERMAMIERGMNPHFPPNPVHQQEPSGPHENR